MTPHLYYILQILQVRPMKDSETYDAHVIKKNLCRIELAINVLFIYPTRPTCSQHEKSYVSIFPSCQRKVSIDNGNLLP